MSAEELSEEDIRQIVREEMESSDQPVTTSRRNALKALGVAGAGAALGGGTTAALTQGAAAATDAGDIGTPTDRYDIYANTVDTEQLFSDTDILIADGKTGSLINRIDMSATTTPIQDAWDAAGNQGTIYYPPGDIGYSGTLSGAGGIRHIGVGGTGLTKPTRFIDEDETTPSYKATTAAEERDCYFTGIRWETQTTPRTAAGFVFDAGVRRWNLGPDMVFAGYDGADLFHFNTGGVFSSVWRSPLATGYNRFLKVDSGGAPLCLEAPYLNSSDETTPEIETTVVDKLAITDGWNKGGTACPLVDLNGNTKVAKYYIGHGNWEPSTDAGAINSIILGYYAGGYEISGFRVGGTYTLNQEHIVIDNMSFDGYAIIKGKNSLGITTDHATYGVVYAGSAANVNNRTGAALSNPVACLADITKKASIGTGYDGGTNDTRL